MKKLEISNKLIERIMEDTGSGREISEGIAGRMVNLPEQLTDVTARWLTEYVTDEELKKVKTGNVSLFDIMEKEKKRFVEAVFTLNVLIKDPELAEQYFNICSDGLTR